MGVCERDPFYAKDLDPTAQKLLDGVRLPFLLIVFLTLWIAAREGSQVTVWFHGSWRSPFLCLDVRLSLVQLAVLTISSAWASVANGTLAREYYYYYRPFSY